MIRTFNNANLENHQALFDAACREAELARQGLVREGRLVDAEDFCTLLAIADSQLLQGLQEQRYFSLDVNGRPYFPTFYSDPGLSRAEVEDVSRLLLNLGGDVKWQFFNTPKVTLGGLTPLAALAQGRFKDVAFAAGGFVSL